MSGSDLIRPNYAEGRPVRRRRWIVRAVVAGGFAVVASAGWSVRHSVWNRSRLLYWQSQCGDYLAPIDAVVPLPTATVPPGPECWRSLRRSLAAERCPLGLAFFEDGRFPIVFLHELTSPHGTRRIVCMEFRPNVDHLQMCSLDCLALTPATLTAPPKVTASVSAWVPGYWGGGVRLDHLQWAQLDPHDPSHFVFRYQHAVPVDADMDAACGPVDLTTTPSDKLKWRTYTVDGWLHDDGKVIVQMAE